ncbi:MAG: YheE family protein [Bacillus sp. (in: Bacteria)]|nr:YheE family protein [Bacillus sp. (in: firmicutes)]
MRRRGKLGFCFRTSFSCLFSQKVWFVGKFLFYYSWSGHGWNFYFYYKKQRFAGVYHQIGKIEWTMNTPIQEEMEAITSQIHELMLFHVYS